MNNIEKILVAKIKSTEVVCSYDRGYEHGLRDALKIVWEEIERTHGTYHFVMNDVQDKLAMIKYFRNHTHYSLLECKQLLMDQKPVVMSSERLNELNNLMVGFGRFEECPT